MNWPGEFWRRITNLFRRDQFDRELAEEMQLHKELREKEQLEAGTDRDDARYATQKHFGNDLKLREESRDMWGWSWLENFLQDTRFGARMLRKNLGFTIVAVLTLALGIGANTAIFSVVHAVLLSSLPYRQPERLVKVWGQLANQGIPRNFFSDPEWFELSDTNHVFEQVAAYYSNDGANLGGDGAAPQRVTRGRSTAGLFPLLGVQPILGRTYSAEEEQPGHNQVVVISYSLWRSYYAGDLNVVGKTMRLYDR